MCLGSLSCCVTQARLSLRSQTDGGHCPSGFLIECRIHASINFGKSSRFWSYKAAPDHHTITTMFDCWYDVLFMKCCVGFAPDVTDTHLISYRNLPKRFWDNQDILGKYETGLCVLIGQQCLLPWNSLMDAVLAQSLSCWIMNTDLSWGKWGLRFLRCRSGFFYDLLD